ncbi:MAG: hypothetical protein ACXACC_01285 [Promethearchaeota archaeon]
MSLERWLKPDKKVKKTEVKKDKIVEKGSKSQSKKVSTEKLAISKFNKYVLVCTRASCKYQKTIMKKTLSDKDKTCPKCKSKMKAK